MKLSSWYNNACYLSKRSIRNPNHTGFSQYFDRFDLCERILGKNAKTAMMAIPTRARHILMEDPYG